MVKQKFSNWSKDDLIKEIKKIQKRKKYGIVWDEEKIPETVVVQCREKLPVLKEVKNKEIKKDKDQADNILIEGDNYHCLSVLNYTHKGKVDLIYIDPPYNTGNAGFVYNDKIVDLNDTYRHSKWLSFMSRRLKLAKNLLKRTGTIFISIDDNEQSQLKMLCDEIFGERNFIALIIVQVNKGGRDYLQLAKTHEYILCYGKSEVSELNELSKDVSTFKLEDDQGKYEIRELRNRNPKFNRKNRPNLFYPIYINKSIQDKNKHCAISLTKSKGYELSTIPTNSKGEEGCWRWGKPLTEKNIVKNDPDKSQVVAKQKKDGGWNIYEKSRKYTTKAKTIWDETEMRTERGTIVLREIFGKPVFDHPKPVELVEKIIRLGAKKDSVILDFFAGSGTTGHAVLNVNAEDGGERQFILCTNDEDNNGHEMKIATDICHPRIEKVINGYKDSKGQSCGNYKANMKYYRTNFVDAEQTDMNKKKLVDECTEMICLKENCFDEVKSGKQFKIFKRNGGKYLGVIYDDDGIEPLKKEIKKLNKKFNVYVFSLDESAREEEFEDIIDSVDLKPIPEVILNVYRRIFK